MFYYENKEYYPLELEMIVNKDNELIYDKKKRNKSYIYVDFSSNVNNKNK